MKNGEELTCPVPNECEALLDPLAVGVQSLARTDKLADKCQAYRRYR
jgi:hypothetical protein